MKRAQPWWHGRLLRDIRGRRFRTLQPLQNGLVKLPAGYLVTVTGGNSWQALAITGEPCPHCGVAGKMSQVGRAEEPAEDLDQERF